MILVNLTRAESDHAMNDAVLGGQPTAAAVAVEPWPRQGRVYNISNFGDSNACYADVHRGDELVFFLTLFDGKLSAKYDDLFGAVAERTADNEHEILRALGRFTFTRPFRLSTVSK